MNVKKLANLAMLCGVALIIFVVELQIPNPFPIPGIKLGLANIVTVYAVYHHRNYEVLLVVLARILLGSIFSGNVMSLIYSLSGSLLCLFGMILLKRIIDEKHIWVASIFGAVLHNTGQIAVAVIVLQSVQIVAYYPFLLVSGCLAGAFTGLCAQFLTARLRKIPKEK